MANQRMVSTPLYSNGNHLELPYICLYTYTTGYICRVVQVLLKGRNTSHIVFLAFFLSVYSFPPYWMLENTWMDIKLWKRIQCPTSYLYCHRNQIKSDICLLCFFTFQTRITIQLTVISEPIPALSDFIFYCHI